MTGTGTAILNNPTNGILGQTSISNGTLAIAADGSLGPARRSRPSPINC